MTRPHAILAIGLLLWGSVALGDDWPRFRGVNGTGISQATTLPHFDPAKPTWSVELPKGYSSPIVWEKTIYLQSTTADQSQRTLHALDASSGKERWSRARPGKAAHTHAKNSTATGTAAADASGVVIVEWDGAEVVLVAYSHQGELRWTTKLGDFPSQHGPGLSPILHNGTVFVNFDSDERAEVLAFDAKSGSRLWSGPRKNFRASYSAPIIRTRPDGGEELVVASTAGITGYNPKTGQVHWNWDWAFDRSPLRAVATPILTGNRVIMAAGDGGGSRSLVCLELPATVPANGKPATPKVVWEKRRDTPYVPSALIVGDHLYTVTDQGVAGCWSLALGKPVWSERILSRAVSASLIIGGDSILVIAEDGQAVIIQATPSGLEKLHSTKLTGPVIATPALTRQGLWVRHGNRLSHWANPQ